MSTDIDITVDKEFRDLLPAHSADCVSYLLGRRMALVIEPAVQRAGGFVQLKTFPASDCGTYHWMESGSLRERIATSMRRPINRNSAMVAIQLLAPDERSLVIIRAEASMSYSHPPWESDRRAQRHASDVYFIRGVTTGLIKIGSSTDVRRRLAAHQSLSPDNIEIVGVLPGGGASLEKRLHRRFRTLANHGEWFRPGNELIDFIRTEC